MLFNNLFDIFFNNFSTYSCTCKNMYVIICLDIRGFFYLSHNIHGHLPGLDSFKKTSLWMSICRYLLIQSYVYLNYTKLCTQYVVYYIKTTKSMFEPRLSFSVGNIVIGQTSTHLLLIRQAKNRFYFLLLKKKRHHFHCRL